MSDDDKPEEKPTDLTGRILSQIRDKIDVIGERLDDHDKRFDQIDVRFVEVETRLMTEIHAVHGTMDSLRTLLIDRLDLRDRVTNLEHDVADLKERL